MSNPPRATACVLAFTLLAAPGCGGPDTGDPSGAAAEAAGAARAARLELVPPPAGPGALAPNLWQDDERVLLSWLEPAEKGHRLLVAELDASAGWSAPEEVAAGGKFFANWADLPAVAVAGDGTRLAHWLAKLGSGTYAYGAHLARATGNEGWQPAGLLHDDDTATEHGFVSWAPAADGEGLRAFWLDGRAMAAAPPGPMQLRTARVLDGRPEPSEVIDDRVCDCCATDAAVAADGPVVVYRDREDDEVRDIRIVRRTGDGGWSEPALVAEDRWLIPACPVNGPAVAADGERIVVAWFTGAGGERRVRAAWSENGGRSFAAPVAIDHDEPLGRVDLALGPDGDAWVAWLSTSGLPAGEAEIRLRRLSRPEAGGEAGEPLVVATTSARRAAGFPRLAAVGERLLVVWVEEGEPGSLAAAWVDGG